MTPEIINEWIAAKHPGVELNFGQKMRLYMEGNGHTFIPSSGQKLPMNKLCPSCGAKMRNFNLCSGCADFAKGYRTKWICTKSEACMKSRTSDAEGAGTYEGFLLAQGVDERPYNCQQEPLLDSEYHED